MNDCNLITQSGHERSSIIEESCPSDGRTSGTTCPSSLIHESSHLCDLRCLDEYSKFSSPPQLQPTFLFKSSFIASLQHLESSDVGVHGCLQLVQLNANVLTLEFPEIGVPW
ncbi:hypothetical protein RB195_006925 [Necator americanus]|uniref:Leucine Rich repeat-containing domain protein n=1 Tax=Necator americanus TaxID=51031 RepID=A0ABR1BWJ2_NECAM